MQALNLLPEYQTGFRAKHSCLDADAVFRDMVIHARTRNEHTAVCLFDIRKAFESVWVDGLCWKLGNFGISRQVCGIITSFLSERTATVSVGKGISSQFSIERGVPQGTVLGPHLYNLFVADKPNPVKGSPPSVCGRYGKHWVLEDRQLCPADSAGTEWPTRGILL